MPTVYFNLTIGETRHECAFFSNDMTYDPFAMEEIARGSAKECVKFGEARLTPIQAAAAYAAMRCAVAEHFLTLAMTIGGFGWKKDWLPSQMRDVTDGWVKWLCATCKTFGAPVPQEEAAKRIAWVRERISNISIVG